MSEFPATATRDQPRRLSNDEAAAYLGLGRSSLEKYRVFGGGPPYLKLGRRVVYEVADLDRWAAARKRTSTSEATVAEAAA